MERAEAVMGEVLRRVDEQLVEGKNSSLSIAPCRSMSYGSEAEEVMQIDHHQVSETWKKALALAIHSSPAKQFGISFGIGW